jgi:hypothetical protein
MPPPERRLASLTLALLALTRPALRVQKSERWLGHLERISARLLSGRPLASSRPTARVTAAVVASAARYVWPGPSCLHRSLVLASLLRAQGLSCVIRYGVRGSGSKFEAHAWVEHDGGALNEPGDVRLEYEAMRRAEGVARRLKG